MPPLVNDQSQDALPPGVSLAKKKDALPAAKDHATSTAKKDALPAGVSLTRSKDAVPDETPDAAPTVSDVQSQIDHLQNFGTQWKRLSRSQKEAYVKTAPLAQLNVIMDLDKSAMMPGLSISANAPFWSKAGLKKAGYDALGKALRALPAIGGGLGGWGGAVAGTATGIPGGGIGGETLGAGFGGMAGEADRQWIEHLLGWDKNEHYTAQERWKEIGLEGVYNSIAQLMGAGVGKVLGSTPERVGAKIAFAGGLEHGPNALGPSSVSVILPDLITLEKKYPVKNTAGLANLITQLKKDIGQQVDSAYAQRIKQGNQWVSLGNAQASTVDIARRLDNVIHDLSLNPDLNAAAIRQVKRIRLQALKPRTYSQLADWRIALNNEIENFYSLNPGVKRGALSANPELLAKKEVADAIRDITYPQMDRASGHPIGTTRALQTKRGIAMDLQNQVLEHRQKLLTKSAIARGESPLKRGRFTTYMTPGGHPHSVIHRVASVVHAPDVLSDADKRAAAAFGHTLPQKFSRTVSHPAVRRTAAGVPLYAVTPETPTLEELQEEADQNRPVGSTAP